MNHRKHESAEFGLCSGWPHYALLTLKQSKQSKSMTVSNMPVVDHSTASEAVKPNMGSMIDRREKHESKNSYP